MLATLSRNWKAAVSEVLASIVGTIGIVLIVALILSGQSETSSPIRFFLGYFSGGQISLSILSLSGIIFIALLRHGRVNPLISVLLYILFLLPIFFTAIIVGINPGFKEGIIKPTNLLLLWISFFGLHVIWFITIIIEPILPSAEKVGEEEAARVNEMKQKVAHRGQANEEK